MGIICAFGVVLGAIYMLKLYKIVIFGQVTNKNVAKFEDLYLYEKAALIPLIILVIYIGIFPNEVLRIIQLPVMKIADLYGGL
jgi:NADH-quinone oxidoreductase subunit M